MQDLQAHLRRKGLAPGGVKFASSVPAHEDRDAVTASKVRVSVPRLPVSVLIDDWIVVLAFAAGAAALACGWKKLAIASILCAFGLLSRVVPARRRKPLGVRVVCISDTHGRHRDLNLPPGDILIHAGDYTKFSSREDAEDFNAWLAEQPFKHKVVVNGNHEHNADWQKQVESVLSNATVLKNSKCELDGVSVYGADFCWPMKTESPLYALIPKAVDIVIAHGPAKGFVDGGHGCTALLWAMARVRPRLVVSGHIHDAHGVLDGAGTLRGTKFVNAANCFNGYSIGWGPISLTL